MKIDFEKELNQRDLSKAIIIEDKKESKINVWDSSPLAGQIADVVTTAIALHSNRDVIEGNPVNRRMGLPFAAITKIGLGLGAGLIVHALRKNGNEKSAKVLSIVSTIVGLGPAVSNLGKIK